MRIKEFLADKNINTLLLKITCVFWLAAKLAGWRMYTTYRLFPTVPVFQFLNSAPSAIHTILFLLSVFLIIALFFYGIKKYLLAGLLMVEILSCLLDQSRLQPWEYQYLFIIFIFIINSYQQKTIPIAISFLLAFTYIYSGLGKLNEGFLNTIWTNTILKHFFKAPPFITGKHWVLLAGYLLGIIELLAGAGLLFLKTRRKCAIILIVMHLFILLLLGPFGLRFNIIVWPWNMAMILYLYIIFVRTNDVVFALKPLITGWNRLLILCWAILPALNFIGYWDNYLSSGIYSGKIPKMIVCVSDTGNCKQLRRFFYNSSNSKICNGEVKINIQQWAMSETNVPVYPEFRVYTAIQEKLKKQYPLAGLSFFYY